MQIVPIEDVMGLIISEAKICLGKLGRQHRYDLDDLIQEGGRMYCYVRDIWDSTKKAKFSTLLCTALRQHYGNILSSFFAKRIDVVDGLEVEHMELEDTSKQAGSIEDVSVNEPLSERATAVLTCIFSPPPGLMTMYAQYAKNRRSWKNQIRPSICRWLGLTDGQFAGIAEELQRKASWSTA